MSQIGQLQPRISWDKMFSSASTLGVSNSLLASPTGYFGTNINNREQGNGKGVEDRDSFAYDDLLEENKELRRTITDLYSQITTNSSSDPAQPIDSELFESDEFSATIISSSSTTTSVNLDISSSLVYRLQDHIKSLKIALSAESQIRIDLETTNTKLKKEISNVEAIANMKGCLTTTLTEKLKSCDKKLLDLSAEIVQLFPLKPKVVELTKAIELLNIQIHDLRLERDIVAKANEELQRQNDDQSNILLLRDDQLQQLAVLDNQILAQVEELTTLRQELFLSKAFTSELESHLKRREMRELEIISDCNHWERKCQSLSREVSKLQADFKSSELTFQNQLEKSSQNASYHHVDETKQTASGFLQSDLSREASLQSGTRIVSEEELETSNEIGSLLPEDLVVYDALNKNKHRNPSSERQKSPKERRPRMVKFDLHEDHQNSREKAMACLGINIFTFKRLN